MPQIVQERADAGGADIGIALKIPVVIEQPGGRDQSDICSKYEIRVKAGAKGLGPSNPLDHASRMSRESRPCGDLSKQLGDLPAGAAADGVKFFPRGCRGYFGVCSLVANRRQFRHLLVQRGLPISALLASFGKRSIQLSIFAACRGE